MQAVLDEKSTKPKVHWVIDPSDAVANALGYATHNRYMKEYGSKYVELDDHAPIALHIVSGDHFVPFADSYNVLFTMWEFVDLPPSYIAAIGMADALVVPSRFCERLFRRYTDKPIYYCPEGVDEKTFAYHQRDRHPKIFRFLWVGAPNPRKGYPIMLEAAKVIEQLPNFELYLKTTVPKMDLAETIDSCLKHWDGIAKDKEKMLSLERIAERVPRPELADALMRLGRHKNIVFDSRRLSTAELVTLYNSAHCFVLPSLGEGWGLTLIEAMATGCPCVAPIHTGIADFFSAKVGYEIRCEIKDFDLANYDLKTKGFVPDTMDCLDKMVEAARDYAGALRRGRRASEHVRTFFTWDKAGKRLGAIVKEIQENLNVSYQFS